MKHLSGLRMTAILATCVLGGCALNFSDMIQPNAVPSTGCLTPLGTKQGTVRGQLRFTPIEPGSSGDTDDNAFAYVLPPAVVAAQNAKQGLVSTPQFVGRFARPAKSASPVTTLAEYSRQVEDATGLLLPSGLVNDPVVTAFRSAMIKASAQSQVVAAKAAGISGTEAEAAAVARYPDSGSVSLDQVKAFANALVVAQLRPTIRVPNSNQKSNNFATYFSAYYGGTFVDRFGQIIAKPNLSLPDFLNPGAPVKLSLSLSDADMGAALTVLIEYLADLFDPTPVLGSDPPGQVSSSTTFFPGNNTNQPTAYTAGNTNYSRVSSDCGVTAHNATILGYIANAAGDEAQLVGGLVSQTTGGVEIGLGVLGKISIGDNQTLGTVVKTAASRAAMRIVFASSYWALETAGRSDTQGGHEILPQPNPLAPNSPASQDVGGPNGYLRFGPD